MTINWSDPAWWSAVAAIGSLAVALVSFFAAKKSASAAHRSADADELATRLAKGLSRTCRARWEITSSGQLYKPVGRGGYAPKGHCQATVTNAGDEVALNVHATGDVYEHEAVEKVHPGESFTFDYELDPDEGKEVFIEWDRPEEFRDKRMKVRRTFF